MGLNQDQIAYVTQASEALFITHEKLEVRVQILRENFDHSDDNLYIAFSEDDQALLAQICSQRIGKRETDLTRVWIEFEVKHGFFNNLIKAVNSLKAEIIQRIFPSVHHFQPFGQIHYEHLQQMMLKPPCSYSMQLDQNQFRCLEGILSCNSASPPFLINGSFGTGKTRVLAVASHCLIMQGRMTTQPVRILICAHHRATIEVMVKNYFLQMLRLNPGIFELVELISRKDYSNPKTKENYKRTCESFDEVKDRPFLIVVTTYLTSSTIYRECSNSFFSHILMDEGSQTREPEAISPLCLASPITKLVIAGDSCQVNNK